MRVIENDNFTAAEAKVLTFILDMRTKFTKTYSMTQHDRAFYPIGLFKIMLNSTLSDVTTLPESDGMHIDYSFELTLYDC